MLAYPIYPDSADPINMGGTHSMKPITDGGATPDISREAGEVIALQEKALEEHLRQWNEARKGAGEYPKTGLGHLAIGEPLYCHPASRYCRNDDELPEWLAEAAANLLASQLPSGNISLANCNIDSVNSRTVFPDSYDCQLSGGLA